MLKWLLMLCFAYTKSQETTIYKLLIISDEAPDTENLLNHIKASIDCIHNCDFPTPLLDEMPRNMMSELRYEHVIVNDQSGNIKEFICNAIGSNTHFIISIARSETVQQIIRDDIAATTQIPIIQVDFSPYQKTIFRVAAVPDNYITVIPPTTVLMNITSDLFNEVNITKQVIVLYDESYERDDVTWNKMLDRLPLDFTYIRMKTNSNEIQDQITALAADPRVQTLLIMAKTTNIEKFVLLANDAIIQDRFKWFILTKDVTPFMCETCSSFTGLWIRPMDYTSNFYKLRLMKRRQYEEETDSITGDNELEISLFLDLVSIAWNYIRATTKINQPYPVLGCYNSTFFQPISLSNVIEIDNSGSFGDYVKDSGQKNVYFPNITVGISKIRYDFDTKIMKQQPPFVQKEIINGVETFSGYCIDLLKLIAENLNTPFEYTIYEVKDKMFGTINDRGEWNGMIGQLISGEADIALGPLSVTVERENYVDFTVPFYDNVGIQILVKKPSEFKVSLWESITVFSWEIWVCLGCVYIAVCFVLFIFDRIRCCFVYVRTDAHPVIKCLRVCFGAVTPAGAGTHWRTVGGRLVSAFWWFLGLYIVALCALHFTTPFFDKIYPMVPTSLDDLANMKPIPYKYGSVKGSAAETYYRRMADMEAALNDWWKKSALNKSATLQERAQFWDYQYQIPDKFTKMFRKMKESMLPESTDEAIRRVLASETGKTDYAFIGEATSVRYAEMTDCRLMSVGNEFNRKPYSIAVHQGSPLKDTISSAILTLLNQRELEYLKEKWWYNNKNRVVCESSYYTSNNYNYSRLIGLAIVAGAVIVLSFIILIIDCCIYKNRSKNKKLERTSFSNGLNKP